MGPLLWREGYNLYYPGDPNSEIVPNYYDSEYKHPEGDKKDEKSVSDDKSDEQDAPSDQEKKTHGETEIQPTQADGPKKLDEDVQKSRQNDLATIDKLPWAHPKRIFATLRFVFLHGITRDVIQHQSKGLEAVHARAPQYENKVEHLWTTAQVCSAMIMSIAHGANDVSNAIGPFTTEYLTWKTGVASSETDTPTWIKAVGGFGLGFGFWTFG